MKIIINIKDINRVILYFLWHLDNSSRFCIFLPQKGNYFRIMIKTILFSQYIHDSYTYNNTITNHFTIINIWKKKNTYTHKYYYIKEDNNEVGSNYPNLYKMKWLVCVCLCLCIWVEKWVWEWWWWYKTEDPTKGDSIGVMSLKRGVRHLGTSGA